MINLGMTRPGTTIQVPFNTYDSNDPSASVTITNFALADIKIFKDGGTTERASTSGFTLLDTDGVDFDSNTGIHGFSVDLSDNTTANFYEAGSRYWIVVGPITVDAAVINFNAALFEIGYRDAILNTTIATLSTQTGFTLEDGPADDDALNGYRVVVHDLASAVQIAPGVVLDYTGSSKTVALKADPGIFTMAVGDNVSFFVPALIPATLGNTLTVDTSGKVTVVTNDDKTGYALTGAADQSIADLILPPKNTAFSDIEFLFVAASDHVTPVTGATGTGVTRSIDGGAFGAGTGSLAEVGNGIYQYDASAADMNGSIITFRFTGTGGTPGAPDDSFVTVKTTG